MAPTDTTSSGNTTPRRRSTTKKQQIMALYLSGITDIEDLARMTNARTSYVATVLQNAGLLHGYFDLYTSTSHPMNVYARLFAGKLGFKNEVTARRSVSILNRFYRQFERARDRAGQHHTLTMALVMFDRARWTNRLREADLFRHWLVTHLTLEPPASQAGMGPSTGPLPARDAGAR